MSKWVQWIVALGVSAVMMGYVLAGAARAQEALGAWHGVLIAGPNVLRVVVHVKAGADGKLEGEFLSPDQGPRGFALGDVKLAADHFSFAIPIIQGSFDGKWDAAKSAWVGQFKQGPVTLPLTFDKGDLPAPAAATAAAPAPPAKPGAAPPAKTVEGVAVTGQSQTGMRSDIDRRSYDITKDLQAQTGSIADALRNIPSVQVDVQGNVSLRGDANVTIMIDGKPSSLFKGPQRGQILQQLPATSFERVEVMTNPSAAFRPDGSAGIINLIPKKARQVGKSGSIRATTGLGEQEQLGLNLSSVGQKLTLTGDLTYAHEKQSLSVQDKRSVVDPLSGASLPSAQDAGIKQSVDLAVGRAAFDYDPDSRTRISGEVRGTGIRATSADNTAFSGLAPGNVPEGFNRVGKTRLHRDDVAVNGSWRRKFGSDPDHELVVDLTQERTTNDSHRRDRLASTGPGLPSRAEDIENDATADQSHVKIDYTLPLPDNAKLKTGYELEYDRNVFDNVGLTGPTPATVGLDATLTDHFRFHQAINGVYATFQHPLGDKLTALVGLRLEDTRIDLNDLTTRFKGSNDDTHLYPSLHLSWKQNDADQFTASYSERIVRPAPSDYDPFRVYQDPFNFRAGNPDLKPQQTHSFELGYQHRQGFTYYLATLYFRDNEKGVTDVVTDLGGGVLLTTKQNLSSSKNGGLELVASGRWGSKITYGVSGNAFWNEIDATQLGFAGKRSDWTLSGQGAINYQATSKDFFQLIGQLTGKRLTPQGYHEPLGLLFMGYRHKFNNDWSLFVVGRDLLNSYRDTLVIDTPRLHDRVETHVKLRAILVGFSYSFGSGAGRKDQGIDYGAGGAGAVPR